MILQQFIDAGWHTVPMKNETLERINDKGEKTLPKFPPNWNTVYAKKFNTKLVPVAGALTGAISDVIAIDCDSTETFEIFKSLDPDYDVHMMSVGKPSGGGTILYKYNPAVTTFKTHDSALKLDCFADDGFIYLPTEGNKTKEPWKYDKVPKLKEMPASMITLLQTLAAKQVIKTDNRSRNVSMSNRLAPMITTFVESREYSPTLFRILTPKSFRDLPKYVKQGHLHPDDVPAGRGSDYLARVSAILGADISISKQLYQEAMETINSLWSSPMEHKQLLATIVNPMIEARTTIDDEVVWQYDKHWQKMGFIHTTMVGDCIESFFDDVKSVFFLVNHTENYIKTFSDKKPCISQIKTLLGKGLTETQYDSTKRIIRTTLNPSLEFGHMEENNKFNLFKQTPELEIICTPHKYALQYKRPNITLKFLETLIPDDVTRQYVLSFLRTKFTTFKYSPVILYLIGAHGSGKDTFVSIIQRIVGDSYIAKPTSKVFLEQYNGWLMDKFFVQMDEYGNTLHRMSEKQEALGKLKSYSGSSEIQIRPMRSNAFNYTHHITFIMTANDSPLPLETQDRRVAYINTPHRLDTRDWVIEAGGISEVIEQIGKETADFCYYLATEVDNLHPDKYVTPPQTAEKEKMIVESLPAYQRIAYIVSKQNFEELENMFKEYGISDYTEGWKRDRLSHEAVEKLYMEMTEQNGNPRALVKGFKDLNMPRQHTTKNGGNYYFYYVEGLRKHTPMESEEFKPVENKQFKPKGLMDE